MGADSPAPNDPSPGATTLAATTLAARDREILKDIISTYVLTGEPVSSRTVAKHEKHRLSAASIRNVMADLEDIGLLRQPHTSAGRVPTEQAYRLYVESLMRMRRLPDRVQRYIETELAQAGADGDQLIATAGHLLSELSQQVGMVLSPALDDIVLKSADFLPLGGSRVLCVLVSRSGFVDNIVVTVDQELSREELLRISNYVTENFGGSPLRDIRDQLVRRMAEDRATVNRWLTQAFALARRAIGPPIEQDVVVEGTSSLLDRPELADVERVRRMLDAFADKARLVDVLSRCLESGGGVRVLLGEDSALTSELDFSLVATVYGNGRRTLGSLGVLGPSRMEYTRMVPLVQHLGETLSRALSNELSD